MIKEILSKNFRIVSKTLSRTSAENWEKASEKAAISTANLALNKISGYKKFLKKNQFSNSSINSIDNFRKLPICSKDTYIKKYSINEISEVKAGKNLYSFSLSSGTADIPTVWPRYFKQEETYPMVAELLSRLYWDIDKKITLAINGFNMGVYASGMAFNIAFRPLTSKYPLTLSTTGSEIENIIFTIKLLHKYYDQTAILSYPTFLRTVLDEVQNAGIDLKKLNLKFLVTGEPHTIEWRRYMSEILTGDPDDLNAIVDIYSATDTGFIGLGTPLCSLVRNLCYKDKPLRKEIFGSEEITVPNIAQYNTSKQYIEEIDGDLVITSSVGTPLVRYNIQDRGGVIKFRQMEEILNRHGYNYKKLLSEKNVKEEAIWQLPFVFCFGREQDTIMVGGGNVFPEQIEPLIINKKENKVNSFKMCMVSDSTQHQFFNIYIELKSTVQLNKDEKKGLEKTYHDIIFNHLMKNNSDYAIAFRSDPKYSDPIIQIFDFREGPFIDDGDRTKPKLVIRN